MQIYSKIVIILSLAFLASCSQSYTNLQNSSLKPSDQLSKYLLIAYKEKADFEAQKMHDWNSAKLYSEKALNAAQGIKILPQKISYWKISSNKNYEISKGFDNLMIVYEDASSIDPFNLAKAISSLDCWAEQLEEKWQTWDITKCRNDFLEAMHQIYHGIKKYKQKNIESEKNLIQKKIKNNTAIVTENINKEILQIIYFDFDDASLSNVSINNLKNFINQHKLKINKYIIVGHTDRKGEKDYNYKLSLRRALNVKFILLNMGIDNKLITLLGKGEESPAIKTPDGTPHPANRRAEIKIVN